MHKTVDRTTWKRNAHFEFFMGEASNTFSITKEMDVTATYLSCKARSLKFHAMAIHASAMAVNAIENYRYTMTKQNELLLWDTFHPSYTVLDDPELPFGIGWTEFEKDRVAFHHRFRADRLRFPSDGQVIARPELPDNSFLVTSLPWTGYQSMSFNFFHAQQHFAPLVTVGKLQERGGRWTVPYTLMSVHAVADGFHAAQFLELVQEEFSRPIP